MTEDRAARGGRDHVISNRDRKWRYEEADSIVNPEAAERRSPRPRNQLRYDVPHRVRKHREDNAADDVPTADVKIGEPSSKNWKDEFENHQNESEDDEGVYDEGKLRPLQRLAETGCHQHPPWQHNSKIPDAEEEPSQPAAQDRPVCQAWHGIIKECQKCIA